MESFAKAHVVLMVDVADSHNVVNQHVVTFTSDNFFLSARVLKLIILEPSTTAPPVVKRNAHRVV